MNIIFKNNYWLVFLIETQWVRCETGTGFLITLKKTSGFKFLDKVGAWKYLFESWSSISAEEVA